MFKITLLFCYKKLDRYNSTKYLLNFFSQITLISFLHPVDLSECSMTLDSLMGKDFDHDDVLDASGNEVRKVQKYLIV